MTLLVHTFLDAYDVTALRNVERLSGGIENAVFGVESDGASLILRIYSPHRKYSEVEQEVRLLEKLRASRWKTPEPLNNKYGKQITAIGRTLGILYPRIQGHIAMCVSPALLAQVWEFCVHLRETVSPSGFDPGLKRIDMHKVQAMQQALLSTDLGKDSCDIHRCLAEEEPFFSVYSSILEQYQATLIHGDIVRPNVLVDNNNLLAGILDFDDAYVDAWIVEAVTIVRGLCFDTSHLLDVDLFDNMFRLTNTGSPVRLTHRDFHVLSRYACYKFFCYILYNDKFVRNRDIHLTEMNDYFRLRHLKFLGVNLGWT